MKSYENTCRPKVENACNFVIYNRNLTRNRREAACLDFTFSRRTDILRMAGEKHTFFFTELISHETEEKKLLCVSFICQIMVTVFCLYLSVCVSVWYGGACVCVLDVLCAWRVCLCVWREGGGGSGGRLLVCGSFLVVVGDWWVDQWVVCCGDVVWRVYGVCTVCVVCSMCVVWCVCVREQRSHVDQKMQSLRDRHFRPKKCKCRLDQQVKKQKPHAK